MATFKRVVVWLPIEYFINGYESLADVNETLGVARQSVRLLYVLAHLVSNPWMCTTKGADHKPTDLDPALDK